MRLTLAGGDRCKGAGVFAPWRARPIVPRVFMVLEGALFVLGLLMTFQGYRREAA